MSRIFVFCKHLSRRLRSEIQRDRLKETVYCSFPIAGSIRITLVFRKLHSIHTRRGTAVPFLILYAWRSYTCTAALAAGINQTAIYVSNAIFVKHKYTCEW